MIIQKPLKIEFKFITVQLNLPLLIIKNSIKLLKLMLIKVLKEFTIKLKILLDQILYSFMVLHVLVEKPQLKDYLKD